jgi:chromosome partitioning protein
MGFQQVGIGDLQSLATAAGAVLEQVRDTAAAPAPTKIAPAFTSVAIAELCGIARDQLKYLTAKYGLPTGLKIEGSRAKEYSLEEAITFVRALAPHPERPQGKSGKVVTFCNHKSDVGKTSTAVALAQAMTLRGFRVLVIDCDVQAKATHLCGIDMQTRAADTQSLLPFLRGERADLRDAVAPTYWHNLSVIPASSALLAAEFTLPARAAQTCGERIWKALARGIEPLREDFDLIVIDTAPGLSHLTVNAMIAADGLMMCCPPDALEFAAGVQFWRMYTALLTTLPGASAKKYDFVTIVYTKVQPGDASRLIKTWMARAYGAHIGSAEIPDSTAARMASAQGRTIYDLSRPEGSADAYRRYREPLDRLADTLMDALALAWEAKAKQTAPAVETQQYAASAA